MRLVVLLILAMFFAGCTCQQKMAFRKFHKNVTFKLYNWTLADNEMSKYKDKEAEARAYLKALRVLDDPYKIATMLRADGFHWRKENVDFVSWAWVTIARKRGDCDDFMHLWEEILKRKGKTERVSVTSTGGGGHAMLLFIPNGSTLLYLLSNVGVRARGLVGDHEKLIRLFYGNKTECFIRY